MIVARYRRPEDFLRVWLPRQGRLGGFFVPTDQRLAVGTEMPVQVRFPGGRVFKTRCRIAWSRAHRGQGLAVGLGLEFVTGEAHTRDLILAFAQGEDVPYSPRQHRRVPAALKARFRSGDFDLRGTTTDISTGGVRMQIDHAVPVGTEGRLSLQVPGKMLPLTVPARVVRSTPDGELGLVIETDKPRDQKHLARMVEQAQQSIGPRTRVVTRL